MKNWSIAGFFSVERCRTGGLLDLQATAHLQRHCLGSAQVTKYDTMASRNREKAAVQFLDLDGVKHILAMAREMPLTSVKYERAMPEEPHCLFSRPPCGFAQRKLEIVTSG